MKTNVTQDARGLHWEIKDDGSEDYRKAVQWTCMKPAAWMVKAPIGSILPLCHSRREAEGVAEKLTSESRIVPLYEYDEWNEIKKAGEVTSRDEGYKVLEAEVSALHAECDRLRLTEEERKAIRECVFSFAHGEDATAKDLKRAYTLRAMLARHCATSNR